MVGFRERAFVEKFTQLLVRNVYPLQLTVLYYSEDLTLIWSPYL